MTQSSYYIFTNNIKYHTKFNSSTPWWW